MQITLYKNCCINNNYQEVFALSPKVLNDSSTSPFLLYLNSLTKISITVDKTYVENSGMLIFDYTLLGTYTNIYEFNYMKVEFTLSDNTTKIIRYCFVNDIILKNELVYLTYSEDYWHSYSDKIVGILPSHLISSRVVDKYDNLSLVYAMLKQNYDSFNGFNITPQYTPPILAPYDDYYIIIEFQTYNMTTIAGNPEQSKRNPFYAMLYDSSKHLLTSANAFSKILELIRKMPTNRAEVGEFDYDYYDIGNIYIFPKYFNLANVVVGDFYAIGSVVEGTPPSILPFAYYKIVGADMTTVATKTIDITDYKKVQIGTMQTRLNITSNKIASTSNLKFIFTASLIGIQMLMSFQGQLADITEDFRIDIPIKSISATEYKQQKIANVLQMLYKAGKIATGVWEFAANDFSYRNNQVQNLGNFGGNMINSMGEESGAGNAGLYLGLAKTMAKEGANATSYNLAKSKIGLSVFKDIGEFYLLSAKAYGHNVGIMGNIEQNITNIVHAIFIYSKSSINTNVVKQVINNYGYATDYIIDNSNFAKLKIQDANHFQNLTVPINYNFVQFETANVYGNFTNKIAKILNNILSNGVKIWYKEDMSSDNYSVG